MGNQEQTPLVARKSNTVGSEVNPELMSLRPVDHTAVGEYDVTRRQNDLTDDDQLSWKGVYAHTVKTNVSLGIFSAPYAASLTGITGGLVMFILVGIATAHGLHILAKSADTLAQRFGRCRPSFGEVGELAMHNLSGKFENYKHIMRLLINGFIGIAYFGVCPLVMSFIGQSLNQVLSACCCDIDYRLILLALLPVFLLGSFIRKLQTLVLFSVVGLILEVISELIVIQFCIRHLHWNEVKQFPSSWTGVSEAFGIFMAPLGLSPLVVPMKYRARKVTHFNWTVSFATATIVCWIAPFAVFGYASFPHSPRGSIMINLPRTAEAKNIPYLIARLYFSAALLCNFLLLLYPISSGIDDHLSSKYSRYGQMKWSSEIMRSLLVLCSYFLSIAVPSISWIASFVGAVGCSGVSLVFPPLIELATFGTASLSRWTVVKDVCIFIAGLIGICFGVITSIRTFQF